MRRKLALLLVFFLLGAGPALADTARLAGNAERGQALHAAHCVACHDAKVYTRDNRLVRSPDGLIRRVEACYRMIGADLSREQVNDLIAYLNETYYRFK